MTALSTASPAVRSSLEWAARFGWKVFPVTAGDKKPAVKGWQALASDDPAVWAGWWSSSGSHPDCLVGVATGPASGIWVLDVDPKSGGKDSWIALGQQHGSWGFPLTARTPSGGRHQIYAYPPQNVLADYGADRVKNRTGIKPGIDVRGTGGLIVCPGAEDRPIIEQAAELGDAPGWLLELVLKVEHTDGSTTHSSYFTDLLNSPPAEGGRDDWLTKIAGHILARGERQEDAYRAQLHAQNDRCRPPLSSDQVDKIATSVWNAQKRKALRLPDDLQRAAAAASVESKTGRSLPAPVADDELAEAATALTLDSGGLKSVRRDGKRIGRLEVETVDRSADMPQRVWSEWADFDVVAQGVTALDNAERKYWVTLTRGRDGAQIDAILPAADLADRRRLALWLANRGCTIGDPPGQVQKLDPNVRLLRYLEAQGPKEFTVVGHLGYSDRVGQFLVHEGRITPDGLLPFENARPDDGIGVLEDGGMQFRYGFSKTPTEVRSVLREILTFHHDREAAVFGAWWAATLLKHVARRQVSGFPVMAIEAPSEAGKTSGLFGMLVALSGSGVQQTHTKASFREALTVNRNGVTWLDDLDDTKGLHEVLRAVTGEGAMTRRSEDRRHNVSARLVGAVAMTGEYLGLEEQKALIDRSIRLEVRSPGGRRSLRDPSRTQWEDMVEFRERHRDLTEFAGTLVRMALKYEEQFESDVRALRGAEGRRVGDNVAVLLAGARLLERLTGDDHWFDVVAHWVDENGVTDVGSENTLTLKVLPALLQVVGRLERPTRHAQNVPPAVRGLPTPLLVSRGPNGPEVWVSAQLCAMWWERVKRGPVEVRTETEAAFRQQLTALGAHTSKRVKVDADANDRPTYHQLPEAIASRLAG